MELLDFPDELLLTMMRGLRPTDLAALGVQCRRLRDLVNESSVWEKHCLDRWKGECMVPESEGGTPNWAAVYRYRVVLPPDLLLAADTAYSYSFDPLKGSTQAAALKHGDNWQRRGEFCAFEVAMKAAFKVGLEAGSNPGVLRNPVVARLRRTLCGWLSKRQDVVVAFGRHTHGAMLDFDMWTSAFRGWQEVPWRRSAMEFLPRLASSGTGPWEHASVLQALAREAEKLDSAVRRMQAEGAALESRALPGVPRSHWWWFLAPERPEE